MAGLPSLLPLTALSFAIGVDLPSNQMDKSHGAAKIDTAVSGSRF